MYKEMIKNTMIKRVIIWGHFTGTHSYIHGAYYKAFKYMNYDTYWIDNISELGNIDLSGTLFLTEGHAQNGMPVRKDCYYILHHVDNFKFLEVGAKIINLCNYLHNTLKEGQNWNYPDKNENGILTSYPVEKINEHVYYDRHNLALYQPWATDLLPNEIPESPIDFNEDIKEINYIGSIWDENREQITPMIKECYDKEIIVNIYGWLSQPFEYSNVRHKTVCGVTTEENAKELIKSSLFYPEVRGNHHINLGYIPCRLFKNISYGCIPCTNSYAAYEFFEKLIPYSNNTQDFIEISINYLKNRNIDNDKYLMNKVKTQHTYVNRAEEILNYFDVLYSN
jgi:hypothetical protein